MFYISCWPGVLCQLCRRYETHKMWKQTPSSLIHNFISIVSATYYRHYSYTNVCVNGLHLSRCSRLYTADWRNALSTFLLELVLHIYGVFAPILLLLQALILGHECNSGHHRRTMLRVCEKHVLKSPFISANLRYIEKVGVIFLLWRFPLLDLFFLSSFFFIDCGFALSLVVISISMVYILNFSYNVLLFYQQASVSSLAVISTARWL